MAFCPEFKYFGFSSKTVRTSTLEELLCAVPPVVRVDSVETPVSIKSDGIFPDNDINATSYWHPNEDSDEISFCTKNSLKDHLYQLLTKI